MRDSIAPLILCGTLLAIAEDRVPDPATLIAEAHAALRRGDSLQEGWEAEYDRGLELADCAIELAPDDAEAYYARFVNLGRKAERSSFATQLMHLREFRRLLDKTLELDPGHAHGWEARGELMIRVPRLLGGSDKEGERALLRAAELDPAWAKPPLRLAALYLDRGQLAKSREYALRARELAAGAANMELVVEADELLQRIAAK